jgi:hypothetical protein
MLLMTVNAKLSMASKGAYIFDSQGTKMAGKVRHGHTVGGVKSPTYTVWKNIKSRCTNPKRPGFKYWGGKGVGFDPRWKKFENFLADMGDKPAGLSIDRIDNAAGYCAENCRWATPLEQIHNRGITKMYTFRNETKKLVEWCALLGLPYGTMHRRIVRWGFTVEEAFDVVTNPIGKKRKSRNG